MAKDIVMPALGMAQETGTLLKWFKAPGETVARGEPLMEIETDKTTVEIEASAAGVLANVTAKAGDVIPVGQTIAVLLQPGESAAPAAQPEAPRAVTASPVAARMAAEHQLDLAQIKPQGGRIQKEDVLAYLAAQKTGPAPRPAARLLASPKARRLAQEAGLDLADLKGSGPEGAILAADVSAAAPAETPAAPPAAIPAAGDGLPASRIWRVMAERLTQAWTTIPHFYLQRDVDAGALLAWQAEAAARSAEKVSITDLLVKVIAAALTRHPRVNASWRDGDIRLNRDINIGLAVAVEDGLLVPVIHGAAALGLNDITRERKALVSAAQAARLTPDQMSGGTFTLSNLGMYGVDEFKAIVNPPQAAILAVGRIAERVVPIQGQPAVRSMLTLSLSCDHRVVDGARGAQFLQTVSDMIEKPLRLLD